MRASIKRSVTGLLIAGALAFNAAGAYAMGGGGNANGPDAFIGIVGGNPGTAVGGIPYNEGVYQGGGYQGGGYQANTGHSYQHGYGHHGGYGTYNGGYYHGY